jgi:hypothetical protein
MVRMRSKGFEMLSISIAAILDFLKIKVKCPLGLSVRHSIGKHPLGTVISHRESSKCGRPSDLKTVRREAVHFEARMNGHASLTISFR